MIGHITVQVTKTAMDFRRLLPEIRWQPRLSPVPGTGFWTGLSAYFPLP
jgi:hypothetical protein